MYMRNVALKKDKEQDYYIDEKGNLVMTREFLEKRGFCCGNGCRHCPYKEVDS